MNSLQTDLHQLDYPPFLPISLSSTPHLALYPAASRLGAFQAMLPWFCSWIVAWPPSSMISAITPCRVPSLNPPPRGTFTTTKQWTCIAFILKNCQLPQTCIYFSELLNSFLHRVAWQFFCSEIMHFPSHQNVYQSTRFSTGKNLYIKSVTHDVWNKVNWSHSLKRSYL